MNHDVEDSINPVFNSLCQSVRYLPEIRSSVSQYLVQSRRRQVTLLIQALILAITLQKKDTSVTFLAKRFFCHTYDTSMMIIVTKPSIIINVVGSYFYEKKS